MSDKKRARMNLKDKLQLIKDIESGISAAIVQSKYGLKNRSNITEIMKRKANLKEEALRLGSKISSKNIRKSNYPLLEEALLQCIREYKAKCPNLVITGDILKAKATFFSEKLGITNFKASSGFISRFKDRNSLSYGTVCGESGTVDKEVCDDWLAKLHHLTANYEPCNIFNWDETALFWRLLGNKSYFFKDEARIGGKHSKERITLNVMVNADGSSKEIIVIGKSKNPRAFNGVKKLPFLYFSNSKAWMTTVIFNDILTLFDKKMNRENRNVLLFVDNFSGHHVTKKLTNIKVLYFPAYTTSILQPCDQGIIWSLKSHYKKLLLKHLIANYDNNNFIHNSITLLDALRMLNDAMLAVTEQTIQNCFLKSGFKTIMNCNVQVDDVDDVESIWFDFKEKIGLKYETFKDYVSHEDDITTVETFHDDEIVQRAITKEIESEEEMTVEPNIEVITDSEALKCIEDLKIFFKEKGNLFGDVLHDMNGIVTSNLFMKKRQMLITDFMP